MKHKDVHGTANRLVSTHGFKKASEICGENITDAYTQQYKHGVNFWYDVITTITTMRENEETNNVD